MFLPGALLRRGLVALSGTSYFSGLWPPFSAAVRYLQAYCSYYNLEGSIVSGLRSNSEQANLYAQGRTVYEIANRISREGTGGTVTDAPPGSSAHNYGLAVDVEGRDQQRIIALAAALGFGTVSWDPAHIEWPGWRSLIS